VLVRETALGKDDGRCGRQVEEGVVLGHVDLLDRPPEVHAQRVVRALGQALRRDLEELPAQRLVEFAALEAPFQRRLRKSGPKDTEQQQTNDDERRAEVQPREHGVDPLRVGHEEQGEGDAEEDDEPERRPERAAESCLGRAAVVTVEGHQVLERERVLDFPHTLLRAGGLARAASAFVSYPRVIRQGKREPG
jgi:hypothetical protein